MSDALRWRHVFPGEERELSALRRWLASLLPDCAARDDVVTVATELGTNAVRHSASGRGGWFAVEITWYGAAVRIAVADGGGPGGPRLIDDPTGEHGRGLLVVHGLSTQTGVVGDHRGRLAWADVPWPATDPTAPAADTDGYEVAIHDAGGHLARRYASVPTWFGRSTLQWWALTGRPAASRLVAAPSPRELAERLDELDEQGQPNPPVAEVAAAARAGRQDHWSTAPVPPRIQRLSRSIRQMRLQEG